MIPLIGAALVAAVVALYLDQRAERRAAQALAAQQQARLAEVLDALLSLRSALVASGAAEREAKLPPSASIQAPRSIAPPPAGSLPSVERKVVSVTRDDDPVHTRATIEAPAPDGWGTRPTTPRPTSEAAPEGAEPPSTKPSPSQERYRARGSGEHLESSPIFESKASVRARVEAAEDARDRARALPRVQEDDSDPTPDVLGDDERTRVYSKRGGHDGGYPRTPGVSVLRPPPHAPPRLRSERPTLYDGMLLRTPPAPPTVAKTMPPPASTDREREGGAA